MNWYLEVLKKYAVFNGRARRKEYWTFTLINMIIGSVLSLSTNFIEELAVLLGIAILGFLYNLAVLIPGIAVSVRRLHDTNRCGWWLFLVLVPLVGAIVIFVFMVQDSQQGENRYGSNPKAATA